MKIDEMIPWESYWKEGGYKLQWSHKEVSSTKKAIWKVFRKEETTGLTLGGSVEVCLW